MKRPLAQLFPNMERIGLLLTACYVTSHFFRRRYPFRHYYSRASVMPGVELCPVTFPHRPHYDCKSSPRTTQSAYNFKVSNTKYVVRSRQSTQLSKSYAIVALEPSYGRQALTGPAEGEPTGEADPALGLFLHYHVPQYLEGRIEPGHLVICPCVARQPTAL